MTTTTRLVAFVAALAAVFGLSFGLGRSIGTIDAGSDQPTPTSHPHTSGMDMSDK